MNTLENIIQSNLVNALKAKDEITVSALRSIKSAILVEKTSGGSKKELDDSDIIKIIQKLSKQRDESASIYTSNSRNELAERELAEKVVLDGYLPKMLTKDELSEIIDKVIDDLGATTMRDMGKVIGFVNKTYVGQVDGSVVSKIVKEKLSH